MPHSHYTLIQYEKGQHTETALPVGENSGKKLHFKGRSMFGSVAVPTQQPSRSGASAISPFSLQASSASTYS